MVTACAEGATACTSDPAGSPLVNVRVTSTSVFFGNPFVCGRKTALRLSSTLKLPCFDSRRRGATPWASRTKNAVASTSTRPSSSASTVNPHNTDDAKESVTASRSAALPLVARKR